MKQQLLAVIGMAALGMASAQAAETQPTEAQAAGLEGGFGFVGELGIEFGGDEVAEVFMDDDSSENIKAGDGFAFAVGAHYRPPGWVVDFSGTVGYKVDETTATNASIRISRTTVELLAHFDPKENWWIAAGPVWHNGVKFDADGFGENVNMGSATGFTLQAGWRWIAVKYTDMEYTEEFTGRGFKIDGSSIGILVRWRS
jgi:opacity protein-like surface antigen